MSKKAKPLTVAIDGKLLDRLIGRLEARIPELTTATHVAPYQGDANRQIEADRALVDEARHLLSPRAPDSDRFMSYTLEELRYLREVAGHNGQADRAFALATAIDRKRGFYK